MMPPDEPWSDAERATLAEAQRLSRVLGEELRGRGWTLSVAESCTGGLLASQIVAIAGSSDYFLGGVVAYDNAVKSGLLGVATETLAAHGAVSWQTAIQMAWGVRTLFGADVALATTGIAGPTGGTPEKPVGLVYIALAAREGVFWQRYRWSGSRGENNARSVQAALSLLHRYLGHPESTQRAAPEDVDAGWIAAEELLAAPPAHAEEGDRALVELTCPEGSRPRPTAFTWRGNRYIVDGWGRTWEDAEGRRHYLVMDRAQGTFELALETARGEWRVLRAWQRPLPA